MLWFMMALIFFSITTITFLHTAGVCVAQRRVFTDNEKIEAAVQKTISKFKNTIRIVMDDAVSVQEYPVRLTYKTPQDFMRHNPKCCEIVRRDFTTMIKVPNDQEEYYTPDPLDWLFGIPRDLIRIAYRTRYEVDGKIRESIRPVFVSVNICGVARESDYPFLTMADYGPLFANKITIKDDPIIGVVEE